MRQLTPKGFSSPGTLLTLDEAAQRLGVDVSTLEDLVESSGVPVERVGGEARISRSELGRLQSLSRCNATNMALVYDGDRDIFAQSTNVGDDVVRAFNCPGLCGNENP